MQSKFWAGSSDSGESDYSSSPESVSPQQTEQRAPARWAAAESSSSDEGQRVAKSLKDRRWDAMREPIRQMKNHMKILDFSELYKDYDQLLKGLSKAAQVVEKEGVPKFVVRAMVELEDFLEEKYKDKELFKKLSKARATAFNTLRAKVRKTDDKLQTLVEKCRKDPSKFESSESEQSDVSEDSASSEDESSDHESEAGEKDDKADGKPPVFKKHVTPGTTTGENVSDKESAGAGSEWSDSDVSSLSDNEQDKHKAAMAKWGVRESGTSSKKHKDISAPKKKKTKVSKKKEEVSQDVLILSKDIDALFDSSEITSEAIQKQVLAIVEKRGRRGVDRFEQTKLLKKLSELAKLVNTQCYLEVICHLVSAEYDTTLGVFTCLNCSIWIETYKYILQILETLENNEKEKKENLYLVPIYQSKSSATNLATVAQSDEPKKSEEELQKQSAIIFTSFVERLDDELIKSLQFTDVHSHEYRERLALTLNMLALLWRTYNSLCEKGYLSEATGVALRITEHMHYKTSNLATRMWELNKKLLPENSTCVSTLPTNEKQSLELLENLVQFIFKHGQQREQIRALLHLAYSKSLHDQFFEARDFLQTPNIQELAMQTDVQTQILYNHNLVQLGICAFRQGYIMEAHAYLSEICNQNKHRELLAQGVSSLKNIEKTPEQERTEKRRLLPYHMHISLELIEGVHNICAMLLEVPHMARDPYDSMKRPLSKHFRRMLETYERQVFLGPPEYAREIIMAATKALQKGNWVVCLKHVLNLNIWDKISNPKQVQEMLATKIKQEAMRTYIFTYLSLYDSFLVEQLANMFDLDNNTVHSIVSKMMINEEIHASWDETSQCVLISRLECSRLQQLAVKLAENVANAVEQNELTLNMKNPKFVQLHERRFQPRDGGGRDENFQQRRGGGGYRVRGGANPFAGKVKDTMTSGIRGWGNRSGNAPGHRGQNLYRMQKY